LKIAEISFPEADTRELPIPEFKTPEVMMPAMKKAAF
jgi:hypothetical protein